jgi:hypothetical protein
LHPPPFGSADRRLRLGERGIVFERHPLEVFEPERLPGARLAPRLGQRA